MIRVVFLSLFASIFAHAALAQGKPRGFPFDRPYKAISISGFDVQKMGMTLTVAPNAKGEGLRGTGSAGCNAWNAVVMLRDEQIDFTNIVTTKKYCGQSRMTAEQAFMRSLQSAQRWHAEGDRLTIEGDAARLLLRTPPGEQNPGQKPAGGRPGKTR